MLTNRPGEIVNLVASIQPNPGTAGTFLSEAISVDEGTFRRLWAVIQTGTIGSSGTVDASLVGATTSGGTYNLPLTGSAITQDTTGGNTHAITASIDWIRNLQPTAAFIKLKIVTAVAATPIAAMVYGFDVASNPPSNPAASVTAHSSFPTTLA